MKYSKIYIKKIHTICLLILSMLCANIHANTPIADIFYGMDQTPETSAVMVDATTNTTGTLSNTANGKSALIQGASHHSLTAWDFGQTENYIRVAANSTTARLGDANATDGITIGFWTNYNYDGNTPVSYIAGVGTTFNVIAVSTGIIFRFGDAHINAINSIAADNILNGSWQHIAVTFDFTQNTNNLVMYLNGNPIHTTSYAITTPFNSTTDDLIIGARPNGTYPFPGKLDDFIIFDEALSSTNVMELHANGAYNFIDNDTYAYAPISRVGGYEYAWDTYTNDEFTGVCPTIEPNNYTEVNTITHAPPVGVHPRIFLSPNEIPDLKYRLENTKSGRSIAALINAYTVYLNKGGADYDRNANYALDPDGNPWIAEYNAFYISGDEYARMIAQDVTFFDDPAFNVSRRMTLASILVMEAFDLLINEDENNPNISKTYEQRCTDLSNAISFWAAYFVNNIEVVNDNLNHRHNFSPSLMALVYDLHYHKFSPSQRDIVRQALAKVTPVVPNYGGDGLSCYVTASNYAPLGAYDILPNLAIEGEVGYKPDLTRQWMRAMCNFMNHGWYNSGSGFEGLGKNYMYMTTLIAGAKRGYSLLAHPHLRAFGMQYLPAIMQPFGHGFTSYDTWGGSGSDAVTGGYKFNSHDAIGLKWVFPNNPTIDFMWQNVISSAKHKNQTSEGYVYQQLSPRASSTHDIVPAAIFALDYEEGDFDTKAANTVPTDFFEPNRGLAVMKSGTDSLSLSSQFHCRQNMGGHTAGDRNDFTLSGLGRMWVRKTFGGGGLAPTYFHSGILINDQGVKDYVICRQPGKILDYSADDKITSITGDATYAYTWEWRWNAASLIGTDGWEEVTETRNDFQYIPQNKPYFNTPYFDYPHWLVPGLTEQLAKRPHNPVQRVIRSAAMIRGENPFLFIVDDVQKDGNIHNYKWVAQVANDLSIESTNIHLDDCNYQNDIILKEPDETGNRRLLVRILNNNDNTVDADDIILEELEYEGNVSAGNPVNHTGTYRQRLMLESNSVAPDFRVMLYPHYAGDQLPTTIWNETKDTLRVLFSNEQHFIALNPQNNGEWNRIELVDESTLATTCDDGDDCTIDDSYFTNCNCVGVLQDADNDLVCNDIDVCPNFNDNLIGAACDDGDPCTELSFYDSSCGCTSSFNYALPGTASMSSGAAFRYDYLNDGIIDDNNLLAYTGNGSLHEWMQMDLGLVRDIEEVVIYNRTNCCTNRLNNVYLLVADTPFPNNTDLTAALANADFTYQIGDVTNEAIVTINVAQAGQYVRLQKSGNNEGNENGGENSLNILEFQVISDLLKIDSDGDGFCDDVDICQGFDDNLIGTICDDGDPCTELSVYKSDCNCVPEFNFASVGTPSLSTGSATQASYLTDGIIDNNFLSHTGNSSPHEWMQIDLGENRTINELLIWNRTNCCRERLDNTYVLVSDTPFPTNTDLNTSLSNADFTYQIGDASQEDLITVNVAQSGRYIRLQKSGDNNGDNHLNILELQVIGDTSQIDANNDGFCDNACIDIQLQAWLEGAYDSTAGQMTTNIQSRGLLPGQTPVSPLATPTPAGQPYQIAPWNYTGTEGASWTNANYTGNETDWILVSFRTGIAKNTEVAQTAALLMKDGVIELVNRCALSSSISDSLYIVLQHRNHIGVMTPQPIEIVNGVLTYDFHTSDTYRDPTSFGQKQLPNGDWAMFAGDANQMDYPSFDVNGTDKTEWFDNNGVFDYYLSPDFNLDGDINGQDKSLWFENNGISSRVPK